MMQHLLRRLVFDVPLLNEHTKMPLKVSNINICFKGSNIHRRPQLTDVEMNL